MTLNPRVAFEQLFGAAHPATGSVLDGVGSGAARLRGRLGPSDRVRLDAYLDHVRAVERRIQAIERHNAIAPRRERSAAPLGVRATMASAHQSLAGEEAALAAVLANMAPLFQTEDIKEFRRARQEGRAPVFQGK